MKTYPSKIAFFLLTILGIALATAIIQTHASAIDSHEITSGAVVTTSYPIVDTGQTACYDDDGPAITCPTEGEAFYGQDAQIDGNQPSYRLSADGLTVYDNVTGLTWTQSPDLDGDGDINTDDKLIFAEAQTFPDALNAQNYGGYSDWRLPTMKELYSLMDFRGADPSGPNPSGLTPFIDTDYFAFAYGDTAAGERLIDSQFWSSNAYVGTVFGNRSAAFGLNLADGRIKGYPTGGPITKTNYVYFVRGNNDYGVNDFTDNDDGTITDNATGLMWSQEDSGAQINPENPTGDNGPRSGMTWEEALAWVQQKNDENYLGYSDWRLPNAKEMQSILDYSRAPDATSSAAIDPVFNITQITNEDGEVDYPWFWTGTTHARSDGTGRSAVYICFGRAMGYMNSNWLDVHGAGAQRSDQKGGDFTGYTYVLDGYYFAQSPQGDAIRIYNYVRLARDAKTSVVTPEVYMPLILGSSSVAAATAIPTLTATPTPTLTATPTSDDGYNLFAPLGKTTTYLIDGAGDTVFTWPSAYRPGNAVYLLENGNLMRTGNTGSTNFDVGGAGGIVEEITSNSTVTWSFEYDATQGRLHHDIEPLPNGNVLMIAWELITESQALAAGRNPSLLSDSEVWPDSVIEVDPTNDTIVWEWRVWDHLVQDYDSNQANFGVVADHPKLIDLNYITRRPGADWTHVNSIDYNAELDQILLSVHGFSEIWVIDHSATTAEAAGLAGDLLYRWGNPQAYDAGNAADQQFYVQHDAQWIPNDHPGGGNILVFNNGDQRTRSYSSVDEIVPPLNMDGSYALTPGAAYGPEAPTWTYTAAAPTDFYAANISGAQRLSNGNTLICDGPNGYFFEVTSAGDLVWDYDHGNQAIFRVTRYPSDYPGLPSISQ